MKLRSLRAGVDKAFKMRGHHDVSVWTFPDLDAAGVARRVRELDPSCEHLPHARMQAARVGDLRELGVDILLTEPPPYHHSIRFETRPADTNLEALMSVFSEPQPNPVRR